MRRALAASTLAAALMACVYPAATSSAASQRIGGARCVAQSPEGVICHWPGKPWAVGVTPHLVFVWRKQSVQLVRTNR